MKLANLLRGGYIAPCFVPDRKTMDLRELVRHRRMLVRTGTSSKAYVEKLKELNDYRINGYLRLIDSISIEIKDVSQKISSYTKEVRLFHTKFVYVDQFIEITLS